MKRILYVSILLLTLTGCQSHKKLVNVNRETKEFTLKVGQLCEIEFRTNASTGFWWQLQNESEISVVKSVGDRYESSAPPGVVGASSTRYWKFVGKTKGTQTLHFVYARDNINEPIKVHDVKVTVK